MSVREAFYFVTCEAYGNAFPEKLTRMIRIATREG